MKTQVQAALAALQGTDDWRALAIALGRLLSGKRDPQALAAGLELDGVDQQALALALAAVEQRGKESS